MTTPMSILIFLGLGLALGVLVERLVARDPGPVPGQAVPGIPGSAPRPVRGRTAHWGRRIALVTALVLEQLIGPNLRARLR